MEKDTKSKAQLELLIGDRVKSSTIEKNLDQDKRF